jgi:hypothetical protein
MIATKAEASPDWNLRIHSLSPVSGSIFLSSGPWTKIVYRRFH